MKKIMAIIAALAAGVMIAAPSFAGMDTVVYNLSAIGVTTAATNSATYVVRGEIESIYVDVGTATTGTLTIADSYGTIFTKSVSSDAQYFPRVAGQTTAGTALTMTTLGSDSGGATSNTFTSASGGIGGCQKIAVAGDVTATIVQTKTGGGDTYTNAYVVTLIVNK